MRNPQLLKKSCNERIRTRPQGISFVPGSFIIGNPREAYRSNLLRNLPKLTDINHHDPWGLWRVRRCPYHDCMDVSGSWHDLLLKALTCTFWPLRGAPLIAMCYSWWTCQLLLENWVLHNSPVIKMQVFYLQTADRRMIDDLGLSGATPCLKHWNN